MGTCATYADRDVVAAEMLYQARRAGHSWYFFKCWQELRIALLQEAVNGIRTFSAETAQLVRLCLWWP